MDDYVEDYSYNNNFWMKSTVLYNHCKAKFRELMSLGAVFKRLANLSDEFSKNILKAKKVTDRLAPELEPEKNEKVEKSEKAEKARDKKKKVTGVEQEQESFYIPLEKPDNSTRSEGIKTLFEYFDRLSNSFHFLSDSFRRISNDIFDKKTGYDSCMMYETVCNDKHDAYQKELIELDKKKKLYFESINNAIEHHLREKYKPNKTKDKNNEKNRLESLVKAKKEEYLAQVKAVEKIRVEYIELQGHLFSIMEEYERNCTNDLSLFFKTMSEKITKFKDGIELNESELKKFEEMDGTKDNKIFSEKNKSLIQGPKRNLFKEYSQDLNHYFESFDFLKKQAKSKTGKELKEFHKNVSQEVSNYLIEIIGEAQNEINEQILEIAKKLKESKIEESDFNFLIEKFETRFNKFKEWKKNNDIETQNYKKVGEEYDDRYCYMQTFLGYFNKTRVENKRLDEENFDYLCKVIEKILELNMNDDIDYSLCDLVVILSSTFYKVDPQKKSGKTYINEIIKHCPIMQKQGFWVGLTKFELNQEIQQQKSEKETLSEENISVDKLNNSVVAKLMSVTYNIMQFIQDSTVFNKVVFDIFKYCKINKENRDMIVTMMEQQIKSENLTHITLDKELILSEYEIK